MSKLLMIFLYSVVILLVANGILVILIHVRALFSADLPLPTVQNLDQCCKEICRGEEYWSPNNSSYDEIANQIPEINPSYHSMMVRLGTDLNFDLDRCPSGSYMRNRKQDFSPQHFNCPTLFLVGARKGGTSSLYHYLSNHPEFEGMRLDAGPKVGETFHFSGRYEKSTWEQYTFLFPGGGVMTGDASIGNFVHNLAPRRIYEACGKQARVVILLRDPVKRFESNFLMRARRNSARTNNETSISTVVKLELDKFFEEALKRTANLKDLPGEWRRLVGLFKPAVSLIYEGLYYVHLMNWLCNFPAENILILNSEEFFNHPSKILDIVIQFLGLKRLNSETYDWITTATYNRRQYNIPYYQKLSHTDRVTLLGVYRPFNKVLSKLLDWKNSKWTNE